MSRVEADPTVSAETSQLVADTVARADGTTIDRPKQILETAFQNWANEWRELFPDTVPGDSLHGFGLELVYKTGLRRLIGRTQGDSSYFSREAAIKYVHDLLDRGDQLNMSLCTISRVDRVVHGSGSYLKGQHIIDLPNGTKVLANTETGLLVS